MWPILQCIICKCFFVSVCRDALKCLSLNKTITPPTLVFNMHLLLHLAVLLFCLNSRLGFLIQPFTCRNVTQVISVSIYTFLRYFYNVYFNWPCTQLKYAYGRLFRPVFLCNVILNGIHVYISVFYCHTVKRVDNKPNSGFGFWDLFAT